MEKYVSEFKGTFTLVFVGCGTAMLFGCNPNFGVGYFLTAIAFGFALMIMVNSLRKKSGCHFNPAVSLAVRLTGGMQKNEFWGYVFAQCFGSLSASAALVIIFGVLHMIFVDMTGCYGANGIGGVEGDFFKGFMVEVLLTFAFVLIVLLISSHKEKLGKFTGLILGITLTIIHMIGIQYTGTSVNPARSLGPALYAGEDALRNLWLFIPAPMFGSAIAAQVYKLIRFLSKKKDDASQNNSGGTL